MTRTFVFAALVLSLVSAEAAIAGPKSPASRGLTAQIDGFHGASGTGKTVTGGGSAQGFASDGGLGTTR